MICSLKKFDLVFSYLLIGSIVFSLIIPKWAGATFVLLTILSILILIKQEEFIQLNKTLLIFIIVFIMPVIAVFLGQLFRQEIVLRDYDSPMRFLFGIFILLAIVKTRINTGRLLEYSIPTTVIVLTVFIIINPNYSWGTYRLTIHLLDPLTFGYISLTLGLLSFVLIDLYGKDNIYLKVYKWTAFILGVLLSILSGSRTGWIALPIIFILYVYVNNIFNKQKLITLMIIIALILLGSYFYVPSFYQRVSLVFIELMNYQWNSVNENTSVGMRISFIRIAWFLFQYEPLGGWGTMGFKPMLNLPGLNQFASNYAQQLVLMSGFHNEILTNTVKSGIWGFLSSISLFIVPTIFFMRRSLQKAKNINGHALLGLCYMICIFSSGLTTEVFNLKITATFHTIILTSLIGYELVLKQRE